MLVLLLYPDYQCNSLACRVAKGFSALPGGSLFDNLSKVANDGSFPMFHGILNSLIISGLTAAICTYFSALTAYGLYVYDFKLKKLPLHLFWRFWLCLHKSLQWVSCA